jgi:hypothetical protein
VHKSHHSELGRQHASDGKAVEVPAPLSPRSAAWTEPTRNGTAQDPAHLAISASRDQTAEARDNGV